MRTFAQKQKAPQQTTPARWTALPRFVSDFSQRTVCAQRPAKIQTKLTASAPGDQYEQEADRVADAVVVGDKPVGHISQGVRPKLYRMVMRPEDMVDSMPPPGEESETGSEKARPTETVQRSAISEVGAVTPQYEHALRRTISSGGEALPALTQSFMESRFGWNFSSVRVHSDAQADTLAQGVNARAFTLGHDIVFAKSQYQPETLEGQRLLAHELAHVVQQSEGRLSRQIQRKTSCSSYPGYDAAADLMSYNCAGLALRTYQYISPPSAVYDAISANFDLPRCPKDGTCGAGKVKFWLWEYSMHFEDDLGAIVKTADQDFHIVAVRVDASGNEPANAYSKNGRRPVKGPGTGPSFKPAARERATASLPGEQPLDTPQGRPMFKVRSNMTESISCAACL